LILTKVQESAMAKPVLPPDEQEEITLIDKATGIGMTIQPGVKDSTRHALIDAFTRSDEEASQ
jgi:hypothetical protein